mmetsp:Transcript_122541/g.212467  ORF Transcript_122541/g.212467 Transcript_122541/m.212467 type:complete len:133 (+) Transcript_122541:1595-1993(+)
MAAAVPLTHSALRMALSYAKGVSILGEITEANLARAGKSAEASSPEPNFEKTCSLHDGQCTRADSGWGPVNVGWDPEDFSSGSIGGRSLGKTGQKEYRSTGCSRSPQVRNLQIRIGEGKRGARRQIQGESLD